MEETDLSIEETYEKVKALISKSELEKALLVLIEKFESEQIVLQYSRLSFLKKNLIDGTLSIQEAQIENAKIAKAILILAKELTRKNNLLKKIRVSNRLRLIELILRKRGNKLILIFSLLILFNLRNFKYFLFWMIIGIGIIFGINYMVSDEGDLILINPNSNNSKVAKIPKAPNYFCIQNIEVISSDEKIKAKITSNTTVTFYDLEKKLGISTLDNIDTIVDIKFTPTGNNLIITSTNYVILFLRNHGKGKEIIGKSNNYIKCVSYDDNKDLLIELDNNNTKKFRFLEDGDFIEIL